MDKKQQAVVSHKLEPYGWRTTRSENAGNYEQQATATKWGCVASAILNYQNKHNGASPTDQMISRDTMLTPDQVRYHMREMEKAGLIKDVKGWPRHILMSDISKVQKLTQLEMPVSRKVEEAKVEHSDEVTARPNRSGQRKAFIVRAKQIAEAIIDHYDQFGKAPTIKWVRMRIFGHDRGGNISPLLKQMVLLGWLHHEKQYHADLAITGLGRAALFGQISHQLHPDVPINPVGERVSPAPDLPPELKVQPPPRPEKVVVPPPPVIASPNLTGTLVLGPNADLSQLQDVDLVIELTKRGFKVSR